MSNQKGVQTINTLFRLEISNFSFKKTGEYISSPQFTFHGAQWHVSFYPQGDREEFKEYGSIYLYLDSPTEIKVASHLAILNRKDEIFVDGILALHPFSNKAGYGFGKFIKTSVLIDNQKEILNNNKLTILCKLSITDSCLITEYQYKDFDTENKDINNINSNEKFFLSDTLSDLEFVVGNEVFPAHKYLLAAQSKIFEAMFTHDMKEKDESKVRIEDCDPKTFKEMLRYIYTGKVVEMENLVEDLLRIADKYLMQGLKEICEDNLIKSLSCENVVDHLILSSRYNLSKLKKKAMRFIASNYLEIGKNIVTINEKDTK